MADPEAPDPPGLGLAIDWLQHNIDQLAAVTRRVQGLSGGIQDTRPF